MAPCGQTIARHAIWFGSHRDILRSVVRYGTDQMCSANPDAIYSGPRGGRFQTNDPGCGVNATILLPNVPIVLGRESLGD
jgi:hypothetical protein